MGEDLNPKVKVRGSSPHSCNLWYLGGVNTHKGAKDFVECNKILHPPNFENLLYEL